MSVIAVRHGDLDSPILLVISLHMPVDLHRAHVVRAVQDMGRTTDRKTHVGAGDDIREIFVPCVSVTLDGINLELIHKSAVCRIQNRYILQLVARIDELTDQCKAHDEWWDLRADKHTSIPRRGQWCHCKTPRTRRSRSVAWWRAPASSCKSRSMSLHDMVTSPPQPMSGLAIDLRN